jgi:hypothetical protein
MNHMTLDAYMSALHGKEKIRAVDGWRRFRRGNPPGSLRPVAYRQFVLNVDLERHLPADAWRDLTDAVCRSTAGPADRVQHVRDACRRHVISGPVIPKPHRNALYGRAVERSLFVKQLVQRNVALTHRAAEKRVDDLLAMNLPSPERAALAFHLSDYGMWTTWDENDPLRMPFPSRDQQAIVEELGLRRRAATGELILLTYQLPADVSLRFPTIADVGASQAWSTQFRPATSADPHGYTMPWTTSSRLPRPEAIHLPISAARLVDVDVAI